MKSALVYTLLFLGMSLGPQISTSQSTKCNQHGFMCLSSEFFQLCVDGGSPSNPQKCKVGSCYEECQVECIQEPRETCARCTSNGFYCNGNKTFKMCAKDTQIPDPNENKCPSGTVCDMNCNSLDTCVLPTNTCPVTCENTTKLPVPDKPDSWYLCSVDAKKQVNVTTYTCEPGTIFSATKKQCTAVSTTATPPTTTLTPSTLTPSTPRPLTCPINGRFPNPNDCKKYYVCSRQWNGQYIIWEYICPRNTYYNRNTRLCCYNDNVCDTRPESLNAASTWESVCTSEKKRFEDPVSCESYYLCSKIGDVLVPHRYYCPKGSVFSPIVGGCTSEENYQCQM